MTKPRLYLFSFALLIHSGMLVSQAQAIPLPVGEQIKNGPFGTNAAPSLASWTTTGTVNARPSTNVINTSGGNAGFNSFFDSAFAVLGDDAGGIAGDPESGTHSISQSFTLPLVIGNVAIFIYNLSIDFKAVFDGDDSVNPRLSTAKDTFKVFLNNQELASVDSNALPNCGPGVDCLNAQRDFNQLLPISVTGISPGMYTLKFELNETSVAGAANATNTAAGIDSVSVTGVGNPIPIPEPATLLLLGAGLVGIIVFRRKRLFSVELGGKSTHYAGR